MSQVQPYNAGDKKNFSQATQMDLPQMRQGEISDQDQEEKNRLLRVEVDKKTELLILRVNVKILRR